jgi:replicative DNA helicase
MATNSNNQFKHISEATDEILIYINNRRCGIVKSLKTRWNKFNSQCNGGIEPNVIMTIAGISGSGKSAFLNSLETDLFDLNPKEDFIILSFNFEMLSSRQVGRKLSYKLKKTTSELYTSYSTPLSNEEYDLIVKESEKIKGYPIYYIDMPKTVEEMRSTIVEFLKTYAKDKWLIITLDHTLLLKTTGMEKERETLFNLQRLFMEIRKINKTSIIQLSQLNREIEDKERLTNPSLHFPQRRDVFGGDSVFQCSDFVIVLHRPEIIGLKSYGINNWPVDGMIYMHFLKCREGEPKILSFVNNLKYNSIEEYNPLN